MENNFMLNYGLVLNDPTNCCNMIIYADTDIIENKSESIVEKYNKELKKEELMSPEEWVNYKLKEN